MITDQDRLDSLLHRTRQFVREVAIPNEDRVEREDRVGDDLVIAIGEPLEQPHQARHAQAP